MHHFFAKACKHNQLSFYEDDIHHLTNVLKVKIGEQIICVYEDCQYLCTISSLNPLLAQIKELLPNTVELNSVNLTLFQAVIKPKHLDWIVTKCTELHLNHFYPGIFARSQHQLIPKQERLANLVLSATKQSGRTKLCQVHNPINFNEIINLLPSFDLVIIPYETKQDEPLGQLLDSTNLKSLTNIAIIVGPEGGFSLTEIDELKQLKNVKLVSLSKTILRSETASFYCLAILVDNLLRKGQ